MYERTKDVYIEQIIKRQFDPLSILICVGIVLAMFILPSICFFFEFMSTVFPFILVGSVWGGVYLIRLQSCEYEYIVTNGEIDIDKIMGRRKRKRILSVAARDFELFAPVSGDFKNDFNSQSIQKRIDASSSPSSSNRVFAIYSKSGVRTLLIFEPNEKVIGGIKPFVMRGAWKLS